MTEEYRLRVEDVLKTDEIGLLAAEAAIGHCQTDSEPTVDPIKHMIMALTANEFEQVCGRTLVRSGFRDVVVTGRSGDGGVDGCGRYPLGLLSFSVAFQCKRWRKPVGPREIRDFRGAIMGKYEKGLFITTSRFTSGARDEAIREGVTAVDLLDGNRLCELIREHSTQRHVKNFPDAKNINGWF